MVSRSRRVKPAPAESPASASICGHGRSGLTWSGRDRRHPTPVVDAGPQQQPDLVGARLAIARASRFGGAWIRASGPSTSRATATVAARSANSASGVDRIAVSGLARKFWMITSWMWPYSRPMRRIACRDSARSASVSPMPMRMPVVNGTPTRPASASTRSRTAGSLSGEP